MKRKLRKSELMRWTNLVSLPLVILLAFSGILMQIIYHMHRYPGSFECLGLNQPGWSSVHKATAIICFPLIGHHLYGNWKRLANNVKKRICTNSLWLSILWTAAAITSMISWVFIENRQEAKDVIEIHDKFGIIIIALIIIHFVQHFRWFKSLFRRKSNSKQTE